MKTKSKNGTWNDFLPNQRTALLQDVQVKYTEADSRTLSTHDGSKTTLHYDTREGSSLERFYEPIDAYEGRHRYNPKAQWSKGEEQILIRRVRLIQFPMCKILT